MRSDSAALCVRRVREVSEENGKKGIEESRKKAAV